MYIHRAVWGEIWGWSGKRTRIMFWWAVSTFSIINYFWIHEFDKFVHIRNNIRIMICKQHNTWYRPMNVMKDKMRHQQSLLMDFQKFSRPEITFTALQALNQISDDKTKKNCPVVRVITRTSYQFMFSLFTPWQFQSSAICLVRKHFLKQET